MSVTICTHTNIHLYLHTLRALINTSVCCKYSFQSFFKHAGTFFWLILFQIMARKLGTNRSFKKLTYTNLWLFRCQKSTSHSEVKCIVFGPDRSATNYQIDDIIRETITTHVLGGKSTTTIRFNIPLRCDAHSFGNCPELLDDFLMQAVQFPLH
jgi:hypothetical protein